jgi:hypothetical protein
MASFSVKKVRIEGQEKPYTITYQNDLRIVPKICKIDGQELVSLVVLLGDKQYPLQYNDTNFLYFSGPGGLLEKIGNSTDVCLTDEYDTPNEIVYVFEKHERCYWVRRSYCKKLTDTQIPSNPPKLILKQRNSEGLEEVIWNMYPDFTILEARQSGIYVHKTTDPIPQNFVEGLEITTVTDYSFYLRSGVYWVRTPSCKFFQLSV